MVAVDLLALVHLLRFDEGSSVDAVVVGPVAFRALLVVVAHPLAFALAHVPVVFAQATLQEMHAPSGHYMQYWKEVHDLTVPVLVTARFWIRPRPFDQLVILAGLGIHSHERLCL